MAPDKKMTTFLAEQQGLNGKVSGKDLLTGEGLKHDSTLVIAGAEKLSVKETVTLLDQALRNNVQVVLMDGGDVRAPEMRWPRWKMPVWCGFRGNGQGRQGVGDKSW